LTDALASLPVLHAESHGLGKFPFCGQACSANYFMGGPAFAVDGSLLPPLQTIYCTEHIETNVAMTVRGGLPVQNIWRGVEDAISKYA